MKKFFASAAVVAFLALGGSAAAQDSTQSTGGKVKSSAKKAWQGTKKGVRKAGNKTAELATTGKAKATDREYEGYTAPNGRKVYVDDGNKYYWINEKGKRVFVSQDQLRAKQ